jgi:hypothetical protein
VKGNYIMKQKIGYCVPREEIDRIKRSIFVHDEINSWPNYKSEYCRTEDGSIVVWIKKDDWKDWYSISADHELNSDNSFDVDIRRDGWLYSPTVPTDRIWHTNLRTGKMVWYSREDMIRCIQSNWPTLMENCHTRPERFIFKTAKALNLKFLNWHYPKK